MVGVVLSLFDSCVLANATNRNDRTSVSPGSEVVFNNVTGTDSLEWYTFHYDVSDPAAGEAQIFINDDLHPTNLSDLNSRAGKHGAVPVQLKLRAGDTNTIRFGAHGDQSKL
jgi:hypothetical protein